MSQANPSQELTPEASTPPTLDEHLARFQASLLDCVVADDVLVKLSTSIAEWRELSPLLQLTEAEERAIITALPPSTPPRQCIDALRKWRKKMGRRATHRLLIKTLHQAKRADLIDELCTILTSSNTILTPQWYGSYLKDRYKKRAIKSFAQWPPSPTEKIFNLAIIKKEKIQRGKIDDKFVQLTIRGKVDDILQKKFPIVLKNIFEGLEDKRKVVLIEGAPGAGKSTLSLDICERWGEGELFQEYEMVILVRLRDPVVQQAKKIKELLPYLEPAEREEVATAIATNKGRGVLWVLDGWDELPSDMSKDSILHKLIQPDTPLHESSVIVTSRPIASADLHPLVSSRIEIVGFTPNERKQFFADCLKDKPKKLESLITRIQENPVVESSCYLPLNAAIIVHLFLVGDGSLPTTVHGIFTSVVRCCLSRYMQERLNKSLDEATFDSFSEMPVELHQLFKLLHTLAFLGIKENKLTFVPSDLKSVGATAEVCEVGLLQATTSIVSQGRSVYYSFLHLSIQELLAAVHISDMPAGEQISTFQNLFGESRFSAVFQFYAGITKLTTTRPFLSLVPSFLRLNIPVGILDIVSSIIDKKSKPLLVSLLHCLYEAQDQSLCKFVAEHLGGVLDLESNTVAPLDCLAVGYFLSNVCITTHGVFKINLRGCSIDDQCCMFLMKGLLKCVDSHNTVTAHVDLNLGHNNIKSDGAHDIAQVLQNTSILHQLALGYNISGNPIGEDGLKCIAEALQNNSSLQNLDLTKCEVEINEENGPILCDMLKQNTTLTHLCLSYIIGVSDTGVRFIKSGLESNATLKVLHLESCDITSTGAKCLSTALKVNRSLEVLNISWNNISDGIFDVANSLKRNSSLKELYLDHCQVTDRELQCIAECLTVNKTLKTIRIDHNEDITDEGLSLLTDTLVNLNNTSLERLCIPSGHSESFKAEKEKTINELRAREMSGLPTFRMSVRDAFIELQS